MGDLIGPIVENVIAGLLGSAIVFAGGFLVGRYRERRRARGRNLEGYDFYPFVVDRDNFPQFDPAAVADHVRISPERIDEFLAKYARTEMRLEENILSREEYVHAVNGKRHWLDSAHLASRLA